jgi:hypothetical protein
MKQFLIAALFICAETYCFAQGPLGIKIFGSPTFSYRMVTGDNELRELQKEIHNPLLRYEAGALIIVKRSSRMDLETGLVLSRKGLSFGTISFRDVNNEPLGSVDLELSADFLEVPFRLNYYFSEAKRNYLLAGISGDLLIGSKFKYEYHGDLPSSFDEEQPKGMRKFNAGLQIGYGFRLINSEDFGFDLEPNFKIQLLDAYTGTGLINTHFYSVGLACMFRFKVSSGSL